MTEARRDMRDRREAVEPHSDKRKCSCSSAGSAEQGGGGRVKEGRKAGGQQRAEGRRDREQGVMIYSHSG
jgi:hypothetical protein